ncbi:MAG: heparin lyase I family protein [Limisphaerales bacterium]
MEPPTLLKPKRSITRAIVLTFLLGLSAGVIIKSLARSIEPLPESEVEMTATDHGTTYKLVKGNLYRVSRWTGKWEFVKQFYDPDFYAKNYVERDGAIFRKADNGELVPVKKSFAEDFEGTTRLADLMNLKRGWTSCELQSPRAPTVKDYVKLRNRILKGESDFLDNRIEPGGEVVHGGRTALKCVSVPPGRGMVTAKSSLSTELLHFVKGDDVWTSIWCHVPKDSGMPATVQDLETTWMNEHPGIRIFITDEKYAAVQLKSANHPYYRQPKGREVRFPSGQWVHLRMHLKLSEKDDGVIELWQDGQKIIDTRGQTLVLAHAIYNSFEIGISAYNGQDKPSTLYVDDVSISGQPIND